MPELTVADCGEFESWPEHMQQLAFMYVKQYGTRRQQKDWDKFREGAPRIYGDSFEEHTRKAYEAGFAAGEQVGD